MTDTKINDINLVDSAEAHDYILPSYLNYSMYVILNRSLPNLMDGLKPVQRRILYAMNELKLDSNAKFKKSARTVGDTLGKYHPHGDSACYEAMVAMAQPFTTHHTLIDGQGNWGSVDDPKSFAAMRYTESKMSLYTNSLLDEIKEDTIDWVPNFDGSMKEPVVLPAKLPNILINGVTGIAVGMATDVPPFNLEEVVSACSAYLKNQKITDEEIVSNFGVPDFPSGGVVTDSIEKIHDVYMKGTGSISLRGTYELDGNMVFITSLPYRVVQKNVLVKISDTVKKYKLPVLDVIDDSDTDNPVRIGLEIKGGESVQLEVLEVLFSKVGIEQNIKVNMNLIGLNGAPEVKSIPVIVREWCKGRQITFVRKKNYRLRIVNARIHIIDGLLVAFYNLDRVIQIVRESDNPKQDLMDEFGLSEIQSQSILEIKLRQLAKLEQLTLENELSDLSKERDELTELLSCDKKIKKEVRGEIVAAGKLYKKDRLTIHKEMQPIVLNDVAFVNKKEDVTILVSGNFWLKQFKGHTIPDASLTFKTPDCDLMSKFETTSAESLCFMSKQGKFFTIPISKFPKGKASEFPATTQITLEANDSLFYSFEFRNNEESLLFVTSKGNGFITPMANVESKVTKGKQVLVVTKEDVPLTPLIITNETELALTTKLGRLVILDVRDLNVSNRSQGTKLVDIKTNEYINKEDCVLSCVALKKDQTLVVYSGKKKFVLDSFKRDKYRISRARRGVYFENSKNNLMASLG